MNRPTLFPLLALTFVAPGCGGNDSNPGESTDNGSGGTASGGTGGGSSAGGTAPGAGGSTSGGSGTGGVGTGGSSAGTGGSASGGSDSGGPMPGQLFGSCDSRALVEDCDPPYSCIQTHSQTDDAEIDQCIATFECSGPTDHASCSAFDIYGVGVPRCSPFGSGLYGCVLGCGPAGECPAGLECKTGNAGSGVFAEMIQMCMLPVPSVP